MTRTLRAGLVAGLLVFASCGHGQPDIATLTSNSDQVIWEAGQKALQKHDWESARQHFKRIIVELDGETPEEAAERIRQIVRDMKVFSAEHRVDRTGCALAAVTLLSDEDLG